MSIYIINGNDENLKITNDYDESNPVLSLCQCQPAGVSGIWQLLSKLVRAVVVLSKYILLLKHKITTNCMKEPQDNLEEVGECGNAIL